MLEGGLVQETVRKQVVKVEIVEQLIIMMLLRLPLPLVLGFHPHYWMVLGCTLMVFRVQRQVHVKLRFLIMGLIRAIEQEMAEARRQVGVASGLCGGNWRRCHGHSRGTRLAGEQEGVVA